MTRYDLLIIGGGVHGISVAYEAARRGRSFHLVDRRDFGEGASSSSLKILHGGLRYLQSLDLGRSRESVAARRRVMALAPSLVRPLRCRLDLTGRALPYHLVFRAGLLLNDLLTRDRNRGVPPSRHLPASDFPCWYDAVIEDTERLMIALLGAALAIGDGSSRASNHTHLEELSRTTDDWRGVLVDASGAREEIRARAVVRCVGAHRGDTPAGVSMNIVVDPLELAASGEATAMSHPADGRNVFVVPWRGLTMIGTWDRAYPDDPEHPFRFDPAWVDELLEWLRPVHADLRRLEREHVRLVHAGLLPLDARGGAPTGRVSIRSSPDGMLDVIGVKWTTALSVAAEAMRALDGYLGAPTRALEPEQPLPEHAAVLERFCRDDARRAEPLAATSSVTRGAVEYAVRHEWASTLGDVMFRRTGAASTGHPGTELAHAVAEEMARHLDWSDEERRAEIESFDGDWRFAGNVPSLEHRP